MGMFKDMLKKMNQIEQQGFNPFTETYSGRMKDLPDKDTSGNGSFNPDPNTPVEDALRQIGDNVSTHKYKSGEIESGEEAYVLDYDTTKMQSGQEKGEWYKQLVKQGKTNLVNYKPGQSAPLDKIAEGIQRAGDKYIVTGEAKKHVPSDVLKGGAVFYDPIRQSMTSSKQGSESERMQELQGLGKAKLNQNIDKLSDEYLEEKGLTREGLKKQYDIPEKFYK